MACQSAVAAGGVAVAVGAVAVAAAFEARGAAAKAAAGEWGSYSNSSAAVAGKVAVAAVHCDTCND